MISSRQLFNGLTHLHDLMVYMPYLPEEFMEDKFNSQINRVFEDLYNLKKSCASVIDIKLIALKRYTEGKASWERAGEISGLGIFGLRQYCNQIGVDYNNLRIDEYYGMTDVEVIEKEWLKFNPPEYILPIDYTGKSLYSRSGRLEDNSESEMYFQEAISYAYTNKCRHIASSFIIRWYETYYIIMDNLKSDALKDEFDFHIQNRIGEYFNRLSNGLIIYNDKEVNYFKIIIDKCCDYLDDSLKSDDVGNLLNSFFTLEKYLNDGYYDMTLKTEMFDNLDKCVELKKMQ